MPPKKRVRGRRGQQNLICEPQKSVFFRLIRVKKTDVFWSVEFFCWKKHEICVKLGGGSLIFFRTSHKVKKFCSYFFGGSPYFTLYVDSIISWYRHIFVLNFPLFVTTISGCITMTPNFKWVSTSEIHQVSGGATVMDKRLKSM